MKLIFYDWFTVKAKRTGGKEPVTNFLKDGFDIICGFYNLCRGKMGDKTGTKARMG